MKDMKKKMKYGAGKRAMLRTNMMPMGGKGKKNKEPVKFKPHVDLNEHALIIQNFQKK